MDVSLSKVCSLEVSSLTWIYIFSLPRGATKSTLKLGAYKEKKPYNVRQGDIYYEDFPESIGSVQKGMRPAVITQNNHLNRTQPHTCAI